MELDTRVCMVKGTLGLVESGYGRILFCASDLGTCVEFKGRVVVL